MSALTLGRTQLAACARLTHWLNVYAVQLSGRFLSMALSFLGFRASGKPGARKFGPDCPTSQIAAEAVAYPLHALPGFLLVLRR
jgi:hypothetical protein